MAICCPAWGEKFRTPEPVLQGCSGVDLRCPRCQHGFTVMPPCPGPVSGTPVGSRNSLRAPGDATDRTGGGTDGTAHEPHLPTHRQFAVAIVRGDAAGRVFPITRARMIIGRKDADIQIPDREASRHHAAIEVYGGEVFLRDLNSSNGTYIGDQPVRIAVLHDGCEFRIGSTVFVFLETPVRFPSAGPGPTP